MIQSSSVSVCIANYNGMAVIDDCIRSVLTQQGRIDVEILVHDDASSDGSVSHIREQYPNITLITSTDNVGFCIANNRMAAMAKGKHILLLNNDAVLYPDALQTLLSAANRLTEPAILSLPQYDARTGKLIDRGCLLDPFFNPVPNLDPLRSDVAMVIGACLWIPSDMWHVLGGFPEWFESVAEDMYLCCRARLAGYAILALTTSGYRHWQGSSFGGNCTVNDRLVTTFRRRALSERNKTFVMVLSYPAPILQLIFPLHVMLLLAEGLIMALVRHDHKIFTTIYGATIKAVWFQRKRLSTYRHLMQAQQCARPFEFISVFSGIPHKWRMLMRYGFPKIQ